MVRREVGVVERRTGPRCRRMARVAGRRETCRLVGRIGGVVVIRLVAAHARG